MPRIQIYVLSMVDRKVMSLFTRPSVSHFCSAAAANPILVSCKLLVCGGGAGGCSIAAKFASKLGPGGCVVVEPSDTHYYQPMWTLVGGGLKTLDQSARPMADVLPKAATWIKDSVAEFRPEDNKVVTANGIEIQYDFMVVALGIEPHYDAIPGLQEALSAEDSGVCSNYHPQYVDRTLKCVQNFKKGSAIFTYPNTPVKCGGAPQKAAYITDALLRKSGKRADAKIVYNTTLPNIFAVKKYADKLWEVCKKRNIDVGLRTELVEVKPNSREAIFKNLDFPAELKTESFEMLHVCPPMTVPKVLKNSPELTNEAGYLSVDKRTLRHTKFKNIFGIGDCTNLPTSKTAAAVAGQNGVLGKNLAAVMENKEPTMKYDGYTSCPLVTDLNKCILAEFDYHLSPKETFPFNQGVERYTSFLVKKDVLPFIYWHFMMKGNWDGPSFVRRLLHLGFK